MGIHGFGIVGCGAAAAFHAQSVAALENAVLQGVCSKSAAAAESFAARYGGKVYERFEALLEDPQIDTVCICTPSVFHAQQAITALRSGKHVVLEKPMALRVEEADAVIAACEESGKLLTVIFQSCFNEDVQKLRALVAENAFGRISQVHLTMPYWRDAEYFTSSTWKGRRAFEGGGALMNQGIHGINLLQHILGMPQVLCAQVGTAVHAIEVEDSAAALIRFENGAMGSIQASTCAWPGAPRRLEIYGDKGSAVLLEDRLEQLFTENEQLDLRGQPEQGGKSFQKANDFGYELHRRQIANLLDAAEGKAELLIDARAGKCSLQIISDIYEKGGK